ncbi:MAG: alpha/beta hydrolase [Candidatus Nanopelagicales bacterium]|nr:alpha/beta hydrolase [Candidatus Nanopelagicales bacterium]MCF8538879.1 alpha/beta hydrolase [Candidatus Nanopelagicales bacterium]MCF8551087.1 alpha/beta hydrolase [Candidatus Nanopelagicales bacterium]
MLTSEEAIGQPGPWKHRTISANGCRFHAVELGTGTPLLLLHGFPTFWWTWRHHIQPLANAGFRVIALDLRGYGGSDHPPQGYDPTTLAQDCVGVLRSLGETQAFVLGHGVGAVVAWTMAAQSPDSVLGVIAECSPHPKVLRSALARHRDQQAALSYVLRMQLPFVPESYYSGNSAARIGDFLVRYSHDPAWLTDSDRSIFQAAYRAWPTAHTAIEFHRWALRSLYRSDGRRYQDSMSRPLEQPVLEIVGEKDTMVLPRHADSSSMVTGNYTRVVLPTGHYPHEENAHVFTETVVRWLTES